MPAEGHVTSPFPTLAALDAVHVEQLSSSSKQDLEEWDTIEPQINDSNRELYDTPLSYRRHHQLSTDQFHRARASTTPIPISFSSSLSSLVSRRSSIADIIPPLKFLEAKLESLAALESPSAESPIHSDTHQDQEKDLTCDVNFGNDNIIEKDGVRDRVFRRERRSSLTIHPYLNANGGPMSESQLPYRPLSASSFLKGLPALSSECPLGSSDIGMKNNEGHQSPTKDYSSLTIPFPKRRNSLSSFSSSTSFENIIHKDSSDLELNLEVRSGRGLCGMVGLPTPPRSLKNGSLASPSDVHRDHLDVAVNSNNSIHRLTSDFDHPSHTSSEFSDGLSALAAAAEALVTMKAESPNGSSHLRVSDSVVSTQRQKRFEQTKSGSVSTSSSQSNLPSPVEFNSSRRRMSHDSSVNKWQLTTGYVSSSPVLRPMDVSSPQKSSEKGPKNSMIPGLSTPSDGESSGLRRRRAGINGHKKSATADGYHVSRLADEYNQDLMFLAATSNIADRPLAPLTIPQSLLTEDHEMISAPHSPSSQQITPSTTSSSSSSEFEPICAETTNTEKKAEEVNLLAQPRVGHNNTNNVLEHPDRHPCRWESCGQIFRSTAELTNHLSTEHVGSGRAQYTCLWEGCARRKIPFPQRQKITRHLQTHTGDRPHQCPLCPRNFGEPNVLAAHLRTHTGERPYACATCGRRFAVRGALTIHERMHTGEKPFLCPMPNCGRRFAESSNLTKHVRTHEIQERQRELKEADLRMKGRIGGMVGRA